MVAEFKVSIVGMGAVGTAIAYACLIRGSAGALSLYDINAQKVRAEMAGTQEPGTDPDVVIAAAGDIPTMEGLAAVDLLRRHLPDLKVRFVNVVDPWLIHRLTYRRVGHANLHVRGYKEEGTTTTTTTPFDMVMLNDLDRYHLVIDMIDRVPFLQSRCATLRQQMVDKRLTARKYTRV